MSPTPLQNELSDLLAKGWMLVTCDPVLIGKSLFVKVALRDLRTNQDMQIVAGSLSEALFNISGLSCCPLDGTMCVLAVMKALQDAGLWDKKSA